MKQDLCKNDTFGDPFKKYLITFRKNNDSDKCKNILTGKKRYKTELFLRSKLAK